MSEEWEAIYWSVVAIPLISLITGLIAGTLIGLILWGIFRLIRGRNFSVKPVKFCIWGTAVVTLMQLLTQYLRFFGVTPPA